MHVKTPVRLPAIERCQASIGRSAAAVSGCSIPALLKANVGGPSSAATCSSPPSTCSELVTSQVSASARAPGSSTSRTVSAFPSAERSQAATATPSRANASVAARPMPLAAPVTKQPFPPTPRCPASPGSQPPLALLRNEERRHAQAGTLERCVGAAKAGLAVGRNALPVARTGIVGLGRPWLCFGGRLQRIDPARDRPRHLDDRPFVPILGSGKPVVGGALWMLAISPRRLLLGLVASHPPSVGAPASFLGASAAVSRAPKPGRERSSSRRRAGASYPGGAGVRTRVTPGLTGARCSRARHARDTGGRRMLLGRRRLGRPRRRRITSRCGGRRGST